MKLWKKRGPSMKLTAHGPRFFQLFIHDLSRHALRYNRVGSLPGRQRMEYKLFIDGQWGAGGPALEVRNKYTDEVIATVPTARRQDVDAATAPPERAPPVMAALPRCHRAD